MQYQRWEAGRCGIEGCPRELGVWKPNALGLLHTEAMPNFLDHDPQDYAERQEYGSEHERHEERVRHRAFPRARSSSVAVEALAGGKRLFPNVSREHRVEALSGKKLCNINERLNSERFRSTPRICGRFRGIVSLR